MIGFCEHEGNLGIKPLQQRDEATPLFKQCVVGIDVWRVGVLESRLASGAETDSIPSVTNTCGEF